MRPPAPPRSAAPRLRRAAVLAALLAAVAAGACTTATPEVAPAPVGPPPESLAARRPIPHPVVESPNFARAVARGTRTRLGTPGPRYWQQYARYRITATLEPESQRLNGESTVTYYNRSPDTLRAIWVHLNQNLFAPNGVRNEVVPVTEGMEIIRVRAYGVPLAPLAPGDTSVGFTVEATRLKLQLPRAVYPREELQLEFAWAFAVPPDGAPRGGTTGDLYMVSYWYPQLAVYDDVDGWQIDPYMGRSEFYMGYADYDVALTVPAGWLVGATGELVNADQVLAPYVRQRLDYARQTGRLTHVVEEGDRGAGRATQGTPQGRLTWHFRAQQVRDFAFGASAQYLWDAAPAAVGDRDRNGAPDTVLVHTLYRPEVRRWAWDSSARYAQHSVEFLSDYLWPYPYPQMTALDGPVSCSGMEYPMLTCIGGPRDTLSLYSVTVHEIAHMWFPMQVGTDERRHAWMDEGLTRFNQAQAMRAFFRGYDREKLSRDAYLRLAGTGGEVELMRHGDLYPYDSPAYATATYEKMATNMTALRAILGDATGGTATRDSAFRTALRDYGIRWINRHPTPWDFFYAFERNAGRDLDWFWSPWWFETWTLDQGIAEVRAGSGDTLLVVVEDRGLAPMPVRLRVTRAEGPAELVTAPVRAWLQGERRQTVAVANGATVTQLEIDPEQAFPDVNRANNVWRRAAPAAAPANAATPAPRTAPAPTPAPAPRTTPPTQTPQTQTPQTPQTPQPQTPQTPQPQTPQTPQPQTPQTPQPQAPQTPQPQAPQPPPTQPAPPQPTQPPPTPAPTTPPPTTPTPQRPPPG